MSAVDKGLVFKTVEEMNAFSTDEGVCSFCEEDNNFYSFHNEKWVLVKEQVEELASNPLQLYELNKQFMSQCPPLTEDDIKDRVEMIQNWMQPEIEFYLLYGREINYFTLFQKVEDSKESLTDILFDCLQNIGEIISIDTIIEADESVIEIWVKIPSEDFTTVLYLFDYTKGVERFYE